MIRRRRHLQIGLLFSLWMSAASAQEVPMSPVNRGHLLEGTIESRKTYADPFNDVDVDLVVSQGTHHWRVPAFWRGNHRWTVRFAPPTRGKYTYRWECTDPTNPDMNGHAGSVTVTTEPRGSEQNDLWRHGPLRVSANRRYLEHADGTPFYWLGDTWWSGLSTRLSWEGFQTLTADRREKGFTVVQIVAGLIPPEERAPSDPGYCNEGGCVWEANYTRINPRYFDAADRRIEHLVDSGIVPALVGAWNEKMGEMGLEKLKRHWRYVIARYGAYPILWVLGGEVVDPPPQASAAISVGFPSKIQRGWTELARYVRSIDPYHHPLTIHEGTPPFDYPLQDESLTDFDLFQSSHWGWGSIAAEVAQLDMHYARTRMTKPLVQGEIGYEKLGGIHLEDFQRTAFWLAMLNGAAGFTYGANGVWESYTAEQPLQRQRYSFMTWQEGMQLPGSYEVGLAAKLLRRYRWWKFKPHPEWVDPRGTTLLEPQSEINGFDIGSEILRLSERDDKSVKQALETEFPRGAWQARGGNFRLPYAAGIPSEVRFIYIPPQFSMLPATAPAVLGLEPGIRYHAYFWEPSTGAQIDLGVVEGRGKPESDESQTGKKAKPIEPEALLDRRIYDARGTYRGELTGPGWDEFQQDKHIVADTYRPERLPTAGDWLLVLENQARMSKGAENGASASRDATRAPGGIQPPPAQWPRIDEDGTVHVPAMDVPYSDLASPEAKRYFIDLMRQKKRIEEIDSNAPSPSAASGGKSTTNGAVPDIREIRRQVDERIRPVVDRLRTTFNVDIHREVIGGVSTEVIAPKSGVSAQNADRVLINLHGGGMTVGAGLGGQGESIPIASLGQIKVVSVDYRMSPEWHFPAASEDVASVYRELLKSHRPKDIGLYGCSSGAVLTAQAVTWFQGHGLATPGAIGLFGEGADGDSERRFGDANYVSSALGGYAVHAIYPGSIPKGFDYAGDADVNRAELSPVLHPEVLKNFPPTLLLSGTRDVGLSTVLHTHAQLVEAGVPAELHVWEGMPHCAYAAGDPAVPEIRQAWQVIVRFFEAHLGQAGGPSAWEGPHRIRGF